MSEYTAEEQEVIAKINALSHEEMARLWRFAPVGHIYFTRGTPYFEIFKKRFEDLGGWNAELSKRIGFK